MNMKEASAKINDPDPVTALKAAIACTNTDDVYSVGFRNGMRYAICILNGEEPEYETYKGSEIM